MEPLKPPKWGTTDRPTTEPPKWGGATGRDARREAGVKCRACVGGRCRGAAGVKENGRSFLWCLWINERTPESQRAAL